MSLDLFSVRWVQAYLWTIGKGGLRVALAKSGGCVRCPWSGGHYKENLPNSTVSPAEAGNHCGGCNLDVCIISSKQYMGL
jgi:hypothetical protein